MITLDRATIQTMTDNELILIYQSNISDPERMNSRSALLQNERVFAEMYKRYSPLIKKIIRRFKASLEKQSVVSVEDLNQQASIAIIEAIKQFRTDQETTFGVYASPVIFSHVWKYFQKFSFVVTPFRGYKTEQIIKFISNNSKNSESFDEIYEKACDHFEFSMSRYEFMCIYNSTKSQQDKSASLRLSYEEDAGIDLQIVDEENAEMILSQKENEELFKETMKSYFQSYNVAYLEIFKMNYGIDDNFEFTQKAYTHKEITDHLTKRGIFPNSKDTIRLVLNKTKSNLCNKLKELHITEVADVFN